MHDTEWNGLKELTVKHMRFGYRRLTSLLVREGMPMVTKRVYRLYREEGVAGSTSSFLCFVGQESLDFLFGHITDFAK
jgi:hypothetical protein